MTSKNTIPDPQERPTLSIPEAGELLGICKESAYRAARRGDLPVVQVGRSKRVPTAAILEMLHLTGGAA